MVGETDKRGDATGERRRPLTALAARLCCCGRHEDRGELWDSRDGCWRWSMEEEERGQRPVEEDLPLLPRLWDVLSFRWYSMGDWSATGERETRQNAVHSHGKLENVLPPRHR